MTASSFFMNVRAVKCNTIEGKKVAYFYERAVSETQFDGNNVAYFNTIVHTGIPRLSKQKENEYKLGSMQS
jgi:hypothetical protein